MKTKRFFAMLLALVMLFTMLPAAVAEEYVPGTDADAPVTDAPTTDAPSVEEPEPTATPEPTPEPMKDQAAVTVSVAANVAYASTVTVTVAGGNGTGAYTLTVDGTDYVLAGNTYELQVAKNVGETYTFTASRAGDDAYNASAVSAAVTASVVKAEQSALVITTEPAQPVDGDLVTVTVTGGEGEGAYVIHAGETLIENGGSFIATAGAVVEIVAYREASASYNQSAQAALTVSVPKLAQAAVTVAADKAVAAYGDTVTVTVAGGTIGNLALTVDGVEVALDKNGTATFEAVAEGGHVYQIVATAKGNERYEDATASTTVLQEKAAQAAVTMDAPAEVGYESTVTVTVAGGTGTGAYVFAATVDGAAVEVADLGNGVFEFTVDAEIGAEYAFTASRAGDANYIDSEVVTAGAVVVKGEQKAPVTIEAPVNVERGDTVTIKVAGGEGTGVYEVVVTANGEEVRIALVEPCVYTFVAELPVDTEYVISAVHFGDEHYLDAAAEAIVTVAMGQQDPVTVEVAETAEYNTVVTAAIAGGEGTGAYVVAVTADGEEIPFEISEENVVTFDAVKAVGTVYEIAAYREGDEDYAVSDATVASVTVAPLTVVVAPAAGMTKNYGVADAAEIADAWTFASATGAELVADVRAELAAQITFAREAAGTAEGERIGSYAFELYVGETAVAAEAVEVGNFAVTFANAEGFTYEIANVIAVSFGDVVTSRSTGIPYVVANTEGTAPVWPEVVLTATASDIADANAEDTITFDEAAVNGLPVSATLQAENLTGELPVAMDRAYTESTTGAVWYAGLPVNTTVTLTATGLDREGNAVELVVADAAAEVPANVTTVAAFETALTVAAMGNAYEAAAGTEVTIRFSESAGLTVATGSTVEEVIYVVVDGVPFFGTTTDKVLTLSAAELIASGVNVAEIPALTPITFSFVDTANVTAAAVDMKTAFDSGAAQNLEVAYENRGESMSIVLPEAAAAGTEVIVKIDGVDVGLAQANGDNATSEWTIDVKDWMSAANVVDKKLPLYTTESVITVEYTDRVGNTMVYTTYPTKSRAQRSISMYVDPNPVYNTVGEKEAMKLELYGKAVAYEDLLVTIGGRSYRVTAKGEGDYDHKTTGRWSLTVDLSEIDFPVDVPTALTVKYVNMTSGSAEVELTYKSWCQPVAVASPFAAGQKVIYGFCEPSSIVEITVNDTVYSNIATGKEMFRFGTVGGVSYYAFELADAMKAGDVISIQYTDFVDNESDVYTVTVPETFDGMTKAQPLGANLVERLEGADGEFYADQRFVTPVEVSEGAEIEVPVLAYAGYQVGTMTAKVADGQLVFDYAIDEDCAYEGAGYTLRVYTEKPSLEDVLADESASLDIAAPVAIEEGVATVWVYAEFDVNVPAERIANGTGYVELRGIDDEAVVDFGMADELYEMYKRFQGIR